MAWSEQASRDDQEAFAEQQYAQQAAKTQQEQQAKQPPSPWEQFTSTAGRVTKQALDGVVSAADSIYNTPGMRESRSVVAGAMTGATNIADTVIAHGYPALGLSDETYKAGIGNIWDHAKQHILDFRDAVAVQDPTIANNLTQSVAQLAIPYAGYSRALSGLGMVSKMVAAGAVTDATALGPHDMRMADLISMGRQTEGKLGEALRSLAPDGSAQNAYIHYLADRTNESDAEGRFKNVLDGFGANMIATPLLHGVAMALKQGTSVLRSGLEAGVTKFSDLIPPKAPEAAAPAVAAEGSNLQQPVAAAASPLEKDPAITQARTLLQAQTDAGHEGSLHAMVTSLGTHIDDSTPDGKFYKELLGKISEKNLSTTIVSPGEGTHPKLTDAPLGAAGRHSATDDTVSLYPAAFKNNQSLIHTITHEAVHAATVDAITKDPALGKALTGLIDEGREPAAAQGKTKVYGFKDPKEFVAEAESNPRFQTFLRNTKSADGRPLWDHYKDVIGGIFGLSTAAIAAPQFEKLLSGEKPKEKNGGA